MTLSLWRGEKKLGELMKRPPSPHQSPDRPGRPPTLSALLLPCVSTPELTGVWQLNMAHVGIGVQQHELEPDVVAERAQRAAAFVPTPAPVALRPMSAEAKRGVAIAAQLTVRESTGQIYLPLQIRLEEIRYEPERHADALKEAPAEALRDGSIWCVFIAFLPGSVAPAT